MTMLKNIPLREVATFKYGKTIRKQDISANGLYPVFSGYQIVGFDSKYAFEEPQLVIVCRGAGGTGDIKMSPEKCSITNLAIVINCDKEIIDQDYLYWVLKLSDTYSLRTGSAQPQITIGSLENFRIEIIEDINTQKKISKILSGLDNKIHLNNQINQTLESIAQAIFKSWFIDFEPVRAKIAAKQEGKDPERAAMCVISGKSEEDLKQMAEDDFAELQATAALFPDEFVDSELGEIPKGWEVGCVEDIATAKGGYAFKGSQFVEKGYPVIKIKNITGDGEVDIQGTQCIEEKIARTAAKFMLHDCDLVMAMTGATVGKIGLVNTHGKSIYLNQRVAKFESEKFGGKISYFLFCLFNRKEYFEQIVGTAQGSAQPNISSSGIESISIIVPNFELINLFINNTDSIFQYWLKNGSTNNFLNQIRDTLLPKLLSGEVEIPDFINESE